MDIDETPRKTRRWVAAVWILSSVVAVFVLLAIVHEMAEARLFDFVTRQPDVSITIAGRHGNLLTGYRLTDVRILHTGGPATPPSGFVFETLTIRWKLGRPPVLTFISWEGAVYRMEPKDSAPEEIPVSDASLVPAKEPGQRGWLESAGPIAVGPPEWKGTSSIAIRCDAQELKGEIHIERLPQRFLRLASRLPEGFVPAGDLVLEMSFSGSPGGVRASGSVTDPLTRQRFNF